jgi:DNA-binding XRE family transcriptional regulator
MRTLNENGNTFVLVPIKEYERLRERGEMAADVAAFDAAVARREEAFPFTLFDAVDGGENPVRVFREYRGMTQRALAAAAGIKPAYLSQIESGSREGSIKTLKALAHALNVPLEMLV